jgi:hypothetical protein
VAAVSNHKSRKSKSKRKSKKSSKKKRRNRDSKKYKQQYQAPSHVSGDFAYQQQQKAQEEQYQQQYFQHPPQQQQYQGSNAHAAVEQQQYKDVTNDGDSSTIQTNTVVGAYELPQAPPINTEGSYFSSGGYSNVPADGLNALARAAFDGNN